MCPSCAREKAVEARERARKIRAAALNGKKNPDSHRISWSDEMVRRLVSAYQGWRRAGMGHDEALDRTIKDSTAGKAAIAEFKRRVSRPGFGNNPEVPATHKKRVDELLAKMPKPIRDVFNRNPGAFREVRKAGTREVVIARDAEGVNFHVYPFVNSGETMVKSLGKFRKLETARAKADAWLHEGQRNPRRRNPEGDLDQAADLYREFHGRDPHEILEMQETDLARKDYTALGPLVELHTLLPNGAKAKITFGDADAVLVVSSPNGRQLYLLGGNQDISESLGSMGADVSKDLIDLGDAVFISYDASKWQTDFKPTIWEHKLGEESGIHPRGFYDQLKRRIFLAGGNYRVERPGIID
jgi:hypothetical protein